jgi:hypothetical protein
MQEILNRFKKVKDFANPKLQPAELPEGETLAAPASALPVVRQEKAGKKSGQRVRKDSEGPAGGRSGSFTGSRPRGGSDAGRARAGSGAGRPRSGSNSNSRPRTDSNAKDRPTSSLKTSSSPEKP